MILFLILIKFFNRLFAAFCNFPQPIPRAKRKIHYWLNPISFLANNGYFYILLAKSTTIFSQKHMQVASIKQSIPKFIEML